MFYLNPLMSASPQHSAAPNAIFIDAAGTLISVREPVGVTYARIAAHHDVHVSSDVIAQAFRDAWKSQPPPQHRGVPSADDDRGWWRDLVRRVFSSSSAAHLPPEMFDALFSDLYFHYARPDAWTVFPDVVGALDTLRARHRLFILSNFDKRLRGILDGHDLTRFFEAMIISSEAGASKPDALIFEIAARAAGCAPSQCVHIGDDEHLDLSAARAAGLRSYLVRRPDQALDVIARELTERAVL